MTTLNKPRITEMLALDRERTQGDWSVSRHQIGMLSQHGSPYKPAYMDAIVVDGRSDIQVTQPHGAGSEELWNKDYINPDAAFIACAPELAEQLRLAVEEVERLETSNLDLSRRLNGLKEQFRELKRYASND